MESVICNQCHQPTEKADMSKDSSDRRGHKGHCNLCAAKRSDQYRKQNPEKWKATLRSCARKRLYGAEGIKHFDEQFKLQNG